MEEVHRVNEFTCDLPLLGTYRIYFSVYQCVQTSSVAHPASYSVCAYLGTKAVTTRLRPRLQMCGSKPRLPQT
jgi:hypothetical protein